jgi:hypothetical protein
MPFAGDLPDNNFAAYKAEMVRWKCKWKTNTEKPSTLRKYQLDSPVSICCKSVYSLVKVQGNLWKDMH